VTSSENIPDTVWAAGAAIVGGGLFVLVGRSFHAEGLLSLGLVIATALLLLRGTAVGWWLAMFWAVANSSAPFVFGSPIWIAVVGLGVALALITRSAREYCFTTHRSASVASAPAAIGRDISVHASRAADMAAEVSYAAAGGGWREVWNRLPVARISRKRAFFGFLFASLLLLPAIAALGALHRGSAHGSQLVDVIYRVVGDAAFLAHVGLVVTLVLIVRAAIR
jgi:hypothetical protein